MKGWWAAYNAVLCCAIALLGCAGFVIVWHSSGFVQAINQMKGEPFAYFLIGALLWDKRGQQ